MFAAELLLGGGPMGAIAAGVAVCAAAGAAVWAFRKKIPHPTEFGCIGCCFLRGGCHKHPAVNMIIEINEAGNIPAGANVYVYTEAGRFDAQTGDFPVDAKTKTAAIFERLYLHVRITLAGVYFFLRQMDEFLTLSLWRTGAITSTMLGELQIDVLHDIIEKDFPQMEWFTLKKEGKSTVKVQVSFHKLDTGMDKVMSPLVQYALIKAARDCKQKGQKFEVDFDSLDDKAKLRFISKVLEGPLRVMGTAEWKEVYFKAVEGSRDRWQWKFWRSKQDMLDHKSALRSIPLLAISTVLPDSNNRQQLYVKYYDKGGAQDLFLSRVDRDRDLWSDGLYEFLERYRQYLQDHPPATTAQVFSAVEEAKRPREVIHLEGKRRVLGPKEKQIAPVALKKHIPLSVAHMIDEAMTGYDDEVDEVQQSDIGDSSTHVVEETEDTDMSEFLMREGSTGGPA